MTVLFTVLTRGRTFYRCSSHMLQLPKMANPYNSILATVYQVPGPLNAPKLPVHALVTGLVHDGCHILAQLSVATSRTVIRKQGQQTLLLYLVVAETARMLFLMLLVAKWLSIV